MSEKWQNSKLKRRLCLNHFLKGTDRMLSSLIAGGESVRNRCFMNSLPSCDKVQKLMHHYVEGSSPFALIRFGLFEYILCYQYLEKINGLRYKYSEFICQHIGLDAGLFPVEDAYMDEYAMLILSQLNIADGLSYWRNIPESYIFADFYKKNVFYVNVEDLYPFPFLHPNTLPIWQLALKGKRVLVVSAFAETIRKQYAKREQLWINSDEILPNFELILYKAIQTNGGLNDERFPSWRAGLSFMTDEILQLNFDLALISCGAYGMPLALALKQNGRKVVQWGGCFQLWFGILGGRWSTDSSVQKYINKSWVYPSDLETPPLASQVNNTCYWRPQNL